MVGIHPKTLQQMAREGRIPAVRVGKYWRFRKSDVGVTQERLLRKLTPKHKAPARERSGKNKPAERAVKTALAKSDNQRGYYD